MNTRFSELTLAEAARRLRRYRPLVLTLVLTLGTLRALPDRGLDSEEALQPIPPVIASSPPVANLPPPANDVSSTPSGPGLSAPPGAVPRPGAPTPAPPSTPRPAPAAPTGESPEPNVPTIIGTGWATQAAGTPAATIGVPDGSLPVGNRLGEPSRVSFLRLAGDWQALTLAVDPDGGAGLGPPVVQVCAITTDVWEPRTAASFEDAPEWSSGDCIKGNPDAAGAEWTFDLGGIDQRRGVALVPAPEAPIEFQIAFRVPR